MDELKKALTQVAASLQVLGANTQANTTGIEGLTKGIQGLAEDVSRLAEQSTRLAAETARRNEETQHELQALRGTFASIEIHLVKLFEENAATQAWKAKVEARLDALEKGRPPAA